MFEESLAAPVTSPERDGVGGVAADSPTVVSISDIHGYLDSARSALLTLADHPDFEPVVTTDSEGRLQWTGDDEFVLVFNGDLFDRGPDNGAVARMVARLFEAAPDGHVRVTLGNHEMGILTPDRFGWDGWYAADRSDEERLTFVEHIRAGHVIAAYEGHNVTFAHAGRPDPYEATTVNDSLVAAADRLADAIGTPEDASVQREVIDAYTAVLGLGGRTGRGPGAGIAWLDFEYMPEDAPPQVVGHTRQTEPCQRGNVVCANTIRNNRYSSGGEAVVVETPGRLCALARERDGGVRTYEFSVSEPVGPRA